MHAPTRLDRQIAFLLEADRLKTVTRANTLADHSRPENSAEHSWHLCLSVLALAPWFPDGSAADRILQMLILHDLVEVDVGDQPLHLPHDAAALARAEAAAAQRLFGLLPPDQGERFAALWTEFAAQDSRDARTAAALDRLSAVWQTFYADPVNPDHARITRDLLAQSSGAQIAAVLPALWHFTEKLVAGQAPDFAPFAFLREADKLKSVIRATTLADGSRFENSAEHSWHLTLFALVLADQAPADTDIARVLKMLVLHDLVEIDAGDAPIFGTHDETALAQAETLAANRIFGLLQEERGAVLRALWEEFETALGPNASFAKSLDRFQPPLMNLASGGGSWIAYNVSEDQVRRRIGPKIAHGAPGLWDWISPKIADFFGTFSQS